MKIVFRDKAKRKGCAKCPEYSYKLGRCKLGKINPRSVKGAEEAIQVMGWTAICTKGRFTKAASE